MPPNSWTVFMNVVQDATTHRQWLCAHSHMVSACLSHGEQLSLISHPLKTRHLLSSLSTILCQACREHTGHRSRRRRTLQRLRHKLSIINTVSAWVNSFISRPCPQCQLGRNQEKPWGVGGQAEKHRKEKE